MKAFSISLFLILTLETARGFSPATPWRHIVTSGDKFFFVMDPGDFASLPASGAAYAAKITGFERLWKVDGWYAFPGEIFLSPNGNTLIRVLPEIAAAKSKNGEAEVLSIYWKGDLKKSYQLRELLLSFPKGTRDNPFGLGGTLWMNSAKMDHSDLYSVETKADGHATSVNHPTVFQLVTLDGSILLFDLQIGNFLMRKSPEKVGKEIEKKDVESPGSGPFAEPVAPSDGDKPSN